MFEADFPSKDPFGRGSDSGSDLGSDWEQVDDIGSSKSIFKLAEKAPAALKAHTSMCKKFVKILATGELTLQAAATHAFSLCKFFGTVVAYK